LTREPLTRDEVAKYYDEFVVRQQALAFNERHVFLYRALLDAGLRGDSRVLELGCGIGAMTTLMARTIKTGRILAVDISPASVALARESVREASAAIEVVVGDATNLRNDEGPFDFITLFDVLEHIPLEQHADVFRGVAARTSDETTIFINIPNPAYNEYLRQHEPHGLQIVDEVVYADHITRHAYANGLALRNFRTYGIWNEDEYQIMTFRKRLPFRKRPIVPGRVGRARRGGERVARWIVRSARRWWVTKGLA
jgi:2-polyprenyl-3-methyl-5-hydroxy-6-metoxy-1,4-benzoquinol methylase